MDNINDIEKDIIEYKEAIQKLSKSINAASSLWNDVKFVDLNNSVREIAVTSRELIDMGEHYCSIVKKFSKISKENL